METEAIFKLHGFSFQREKKRFRWEKKGESESIISSGLHFNSPLIHGRSRYIMKRERKEREKNLGEE